MQMNVQIYFIGYSVLFGLLVPFLNVHNVALYSKLLAHREVGLEISLRFYMDILGTLSRGIRFMLFGLLCTGSTSFYVKINFKIP